MGRTISWFSCGAASTVATAMTPAAMPVYCETGAEHPDNERFLLDCQRWFDRKILKLKSDKYKDTWDLWGRRKWLSGPDGALCTIELKVVLRLAFQRPDDIHVFGYTADKRDMARASALRENFPELQIRTPLIDRGVTKAETLALVQSAGITLPPMYAMGFHNNNCIPCVRATSPNYWSLVRQKFPEHFDRMAELSRRLGVRLCRIKGERRFIDEIPFDWPTTNPIAPSCDFLCHLLEQELQP